MSRESKVSNTEKRYNELHRMFGEYLDLKECVENIISRIKSEYEKNTISETTYNNEIAYWQSVYNVAESHAETVWNVSGVYYDQLNLEDENERMNERIERLENELQYKREEELLKMSDEDFEETINEWKKPHLKSVYFDERVKYEDDDEYEDDFEYDDDEYEDDDEYDDDDELEYEEIMQMYEEN